MKFSCWLSTLAALVVSLTISAPVDADARNTSSLPQHEKGASGSIGKRSSEKEKRQKEASRKKKEKTKATKTSKAKAEKKKKKQTATKKRSDKKRLANTSERKKKRTKRSRRNTPSPQPIQASSPIKTLATSNGADPNERALWLQRTQNNTEIMSGKASWYSNNLHNKATASGYNYDMYTFTAAHRTLPMGTVVKVTDHSNGKSVMVCVTDRGPFIRGRIIDLSYAAAKQLNLNKRGVGNVDLEVVSDENGTPLKDNQAYFVRYASGTGKQDIGPFRAFADAATMHEAMRQAHPEAEVVLGPAQ